MKEKVKIKLRLDQGVELPKYETEDAAGFDLKCTKVLKIFNGVKEIPVDLIQRSIDEKGQFMLRPHERALLGTGIYSEIPKGYQVEVRPRSGVTLKRGLYVMLGTIDADYRGEWGVVIINTSNYLNKIVIGEKIAQGVLMTAEQGELCADMELSETERGTGGFGSTDKPKENGQ